RTKPKAKILFEYGIINLNDGIILEALNQLVISHFEIKMQEYKPKKALFVETSLKDLGKALTEVKIEYNNLNYNIVYLHHLFEKFFLLFQDKSIINLDNKDLSEANWLTNMQPVDFSIIDFEIAEEVTTFPKMTKVVAKMLLL
ncbi:13497_t:CDS:2, partial [Funneliformis mosseae]